MPEIFCRSSQKMVEIMTGQAGFKVIVSRLIYGWISKVCIVIMVKNNCIIIVLRLKIKLSLAHLQDLIPTLAGIKYIKQYHQPK